MPMEGHVANNSKSPSPEGLLDSSYQSLYPYIQESRQQSCHVYQRPYPSHIVSTSQPGLQGERGYVLEQWPNREPAYLPSYASQPVRVRSSQHPGYAAAQPVYAYQPGPAYEPVPPLTPYNTPIYQGAGPASQQLFSEPPPACAPSPVHLQPTPPSAYQPGPSFTSHHFSTSQSHPAYPPNNAPAPPPPPPEPSLYDRLPPPQSAYASSHHEHYSYPSLPPAPPPSRQSPYHNPTYIYDPIHNHDFGRGPFRDTRQYLSFIPSRPVLPCNPHFSYKLAHLDLRHFPYGRRNHSRYRYPRSDPAPFSAYDPQTIPSTSHSHSQLPPASHDPSPFQPHSHSPLPPAISLRSLEQGLEAHLRRQEGDMFDEREWEREQERLRAEARGLRERGWEVLDGRMRDQVRGERGIREWEESRGPGWHLDMERLREIWRMREREMQEMGLPEEEQVRMLNETETIRLRRVEEEDPERRRPQEQEQRRILEEEEQRMKERDEQRRRSGEEIRRLMEQDEQRRSVRQEEEAQRLMAAGSSRAGVGSQRNAKRSQ